jgi:universal stress protein A
VHILLTTDFSAEAEASLAAARKLTVSLAKDNVKYTLLAVLEDLAQKSAQFQFALAMLDSHGVREEVNKQAKEELRELANKYLAGLPVETVVVRASKAVYLEIADYAASHNADLIVVAAHSRSGISPIIMGGVLEKIVREAPCPVVVIPAPRKE